MNSQTKVGLLFLGVVVLVIGFALAIGSFSPFSNSRELVVAYNFAGGLEVGSPVRVMGIKVGRVKSIDFKPSFKMPGTGEEVQLLVTVAINKKAWPTIRKDSRYYINLAGVIGEKFLEITPGTSEAGPVQSGDVVRGEDPPRIDQLISQSYSLAGKILDLVDKNEGSVVHTIETMNRLVVNFDKALQQLQKTSKNKDVQKILENLGVVSSDMAFFSQKLRSPKGQDTLALINELIHRLKPLDAKAIKKFLQDDGIRAKIF